MFSSSRNSHIKGEDQELKGHLRFPKKRGRTPKVRTKEPQEKRPKEHPKFIQLDVSEILKMLKQNLKTNNVMVKPKQTIEK